MNLETLNNNDFWDNVLLVIRYKIENLNIEDIELDFNQLYIIYSLLNSILNLSNNSILSKELFINDINIQISDSINNNFIDQFYEFVVSNIDKIFILREMNKRNYVSDELSCFKINIIKNITNESIKYNNNSYVLIEFIKKDNTQKIEIDSENISNLIALLKNIYNKLL